MQRYLLTVAYDGSSFLGWQRQASDAKENARNENGRKENKRKENKRKENKRKENKRKENKRKENKRKSVQATLEEAVLQFCQQKATLHAAGRTDQGVHALAQRAHLDLDLSQYDPNKRPHEELLRDAVNFHLKNQPVVVKSVQAVSSDFHARFSATSREYLYRIVVSPTRPILRDGGVWYRMTNARRQRRWGNDLEEGLARLQESAQDFLGENDFAAFRSSACQARSSIKRMYKVQVTRDDDEIRLVFQASGFLHRQVRFMTGTLLAIAEQRMPTDSVRRLLVRDGGDALASDLRPPSRFAAPPQGLYFASATYDNDFLKR